MFMFVVRLAGIEPTTLWFVARYSIQLSYSRTACRLYKQKCSFNMFQRTHHHPSRYFAL